MSQITKVSQVRLNPEHEQTTRTPPRAPGWVKVFGIIIVGLALLFVTLHLTGLGMGNVMQMMHGSPTQLSGSQP